MPSRTSPPPAAAASDVNSATPASLQIIKFLCFPLPDGTLCTGYGERMQLQSHIKYVVSHTLLLLRLAKGYPNFAAARYAAMAVTYSPSESITTASMASDCSFPMALGVTQGDEQTVIPSFQGTASATSVIASPIPRVVTASAQGSGPLSVSHHKLGSPLSNMSAHQGLPPSSTSACGV